MLQARTRHLSSSHIHQNLNKIIELNSNSYAQMPMKVQMANNNSHQQITIASSLATSNQISNAKQVTAANSKKVISSNSALDKEKQKASYKHVPHSQK